MRSVPILQLNGLSPNCQSDQLVTKAYTKDRYLGGAHQSSERLNCLRAMGRVAWAVGDEHAIEVMCHFLDGIVEGEASHAATTTDQGS